MLLLGTEDPIMPLEGGKPGLKGTKSSSVLSAVDTVETWLRYLGLPSDLQVIELPDCVLDDRSTVSRMIYTDGEASLWCYQVNGGGHAWPGMEPYSRIERQANGYKNQDVQAVDEAWRFFQNSIEN